MSPSEYAIDPNLFASSSIACIEADYKNAQKTNLRRENCFVAAFASGLPPDNIRIEEIMQVMEKGINQACANKGLPAVNANAFNNARGSWFELLATITLWNLRIDHPKSHSSVLVKLPNVGTMKFIDLFEPRARAMLNDLETSLSLKGVNLVTSNPDIICVSNLQDMDSTSEFQTKFLNASQDCITTITNAYTKIVGKCKYNSIRFGLALKSSTRPDRRLQIPHEGSIMKAINAHLQTRFWDASHNVDYYAATASPIKQADIEAFKTAATHSITDVNVKPMPAVDKSFYLATLSDVKAMFEECMAVKDD
ncbi:MAG: restriction endonuclease [Dehalococcoidia bacterium]|nr:restriction endonuclease [Dehalococcoidia bacterium]